MNIQSLTEAEIQDIYKKKLFLETIKNGKTPRRSGLGTRLYNLAGYTDSIYCNIESNMPVKYFKAKPNLTKVLCYNRNCENPGVNLNNFSMIISSEPGAPPPFTTITGRSILTAVLQFYR